MKRLEALRWRRKADHEGLVLKKRGIAHTPRTRAHIAKRAQEHSKEEGGFAELLAGIKFPCC